MYFQSLANLTMELMLSGEPEGCPVETSPEKDLLLGDVEADGAPVEPRFRRPRLRPSCVPGEWWWLLLFW